MKYYYDRDIDNIVSSEDDLQKQLCTFDQALSFKMKPIIDKLDRHRNQKDFGIATTLTDAEATTLANELQSFRDKVDGDIL